MIRPARLLAIFAAAMCIFSTGARCATTGLLLIPTADTIGDGQFQLQLEIDQPATPSNLNYWYLDTEFGLGDRWELGLDHSLAGAPRPHILTNWKYQFAPVEFGRVGAAVGMDNWDEKPATGPYVLGTADLGPIRITMGGTYLFGAGRFVAGIDTGLQRKLTWMADYTSGQGLYSSAGLNYRITPDITIQGGLEFANGHGPTYVTIQLAWNGTFLHD